MRSIIFLAFFSFFLSCSRSENSFLSDQIQVDGLQKSVEILRDQWGINHIYAQNQHDLFFAQGYAAAKDRLFQFEIWRRQATGSVAEILGAEEINRDIGARLFKFRGDLTEELNHYHPQGKVIIGAYVEGVNQYITEILETPEKLPLPFKMMNILPQKWTADVVISRHQGLLGNIVEELQIGRAVAKLGPQKVKDLIWFHPKEPKITLDNKIDQELIFEDILAPYNAFRKNIQFQAKHLDSIYRDPDAIDYVNQYKGLSKDSLAIGSNNWVLNGSKTIDGNTYMANDPHRTIAVPSLRYMAHLVAPGWNVIGGGEPEIPGISIGHNQYGAWGLTVFRTDGEDLYQYQLNPKNPLQYKYQGKWRDFKIIKEKIVVKGAEDKEVELYYTLHGPVTYLNKKALKAFAVRCAWLEPGGSPYLASLRMDQAKNWEEFKFACSFSNIPGENMVWADREGNIGWQAVGIAPIRETFSGLVPVPGNGSYEWGGYLPILEKPNSSNPEKGYIATANQNITPSNYTRWDAIGYTWSDPYRGERIDEVLSRRNDFNMDDMKALQVDVTSLPARTLVPFLENISQNDFDKEILKDLFEWDYQLKPNSIAASIYVSWEKEIIREASDRFIPESAKPYISSLQLKRIIEWIKEPKDMFLGPLERDLFLHNTFGKAVANLKSRLGEDPKKWQYGQVKNKHSFITHALGKVTNNIFSEKLNIGPLPRGGNGYTTGSTGGDYRQSSGASFRMIVNTGDWDAAIGTNSPGQSGDPKSPFYSNLFKDWAEDQYFPIYFSKDKIEGVTYKKTILNPKFNLPKQ